MGPPGVRVDARRSSLWVLLLLQLVLGSGYAWSVFGLGLGSRLDPAAGPAASTLPLGLLIGLVYVGCVLERRWPPRRPHHAIAIGGAVHSLALVVGGAAGQLGELWIAVIGYATLGGLGLGFAYLPLLALLRQCFVGQPTRGTWVTGLGFGCGSFATALIAGWLMDRTTVGVFGAMTAIGLGQVVLVGAAVLLLGRPAEAARLSGAPPRSTLELPEAFRSRTWITLVVMLAAQSAIGLAVMSRMAQSASEFGGQSFTQAAVTVAVATLMTGVGPVCWTVIARKVGFGATLRTILIVSGVSTAAVPHAPGQWSILVILMICTWCYSGVFGVVGGALGQAFGPTYGPQMYGRALVGWSIGGLVGPGLLVVLSLELGSPAAYALVGLLGPLVACLRPASGELAAAPSFVPHTVP